MKHLIKSMVAIALAVGMCLCVGAVAPIDQSDPVFNTSPYFLRLNDDNEVVVEDFMSYGERYLFALKDEEGKTISKSDVVDGIKVKATFDDGKEIVDGVDVKKYKVEDTEVMNLVGTVDSGYVYFVTLDIKERNIKDETLLDGTIKITKNRNGDEYPSIKSGDDVEFDVTADVMFEKYEAEDSITIEAEKTVVVNKFTSDEDFDDVELIFINDETMVFNGNMTGQGKFVAYVDTDFNETIANKYPNANFDFINTNGITLNRTGELSIYADEGTYLYEVDGDTLREISSAYYDVNDECFVVKTNKIRSYMISDTELDIHDRVVDVEVGNDGIAIVDPVTPVINPPTGAIA